MCVCTSMLGLTPPTKMKINKLFVFIGERETVGKVGLLLLHVPHLFFFGAFTDVCDTAPSIYCMQYVVISFSQFVCLCVSPA